MEVVNTCQIWETMQVVDMVDRQPGSKTVCRAPFTAGCFILALC